ncbi:MAG: PAS domain S-box protein [Candidatus Lokiarchaeota archaeon]|nr:PAS domain S-box protein [Candidatus Lokiarchaeota archaeon]
MSKESSDFKYRAIFDNMDQPIYIADPCNYEILYANNVLDDLFPGNLIGKKCYKVLQNLESPCPFCTNDKLFGENPISPYIWEHYNNELDRYYRCIDQAVDWDTRGKVRFEMAIDITKQKKLEKTLEEQKEWLTTTLKSIGDGVIATDKNARVVFLNPEAEYLTDWSLEDAKGKEINEVFQIISEKTDKTVENPIKRVLKEGIVVGLANHTILISKNGTRRNIADSGAPIKDKEGNIIGVILVFRDVTDEYKTKKQLKYSELKFRQKAIELETIMDAIPGLVFYKDKQNNLLRVNKFFAEAHHLSKEELEGKNCFDLYPEKEAQSYWNDDLDVLNSKESKLNIIEPWDTEDKRYWLSTSKIPHINKEGKADGIIGISLDITELKSAKEEIKRSKENLDSILSNLKDPVFVISQDFKILFSNDSGIEIFGENIIGKKCHKIIKNYEKPCDQCPQRNLLKNQLCETRFEQCIKPISSAAMRFFDILFSPVIYDGHKAVISVYRDITEKKNMRSKLESMNKQLKLLNKIIRFGNESQSLDILARGIIDVILETTEFSGGGIYIKDFENNVANLVYHKGLPLDFVEDVQSITFEKKTYRKVLIEGKSLYTEDYSEIEPEKSKKWKLLSLASIPLNAKGKITGALNVTTNYKKKICVLS